MRKFIFCAVIQDIGRIERYHSFRTFAKFSEKLTKPTSSYAYICAYQGVRNVSFSENFASVRNK